VWGSLSGTGAQDTAPAADHPIGATLHAIKTGQYGNELCKVVICQFRRTLSKFAKGTYEAIP
jgi:hypothetical protein